MKNKAIATFGPPSRLLLTRLLVDYTNKTGEKLRVHMAPARVGKFAPTVDSLTLEGDRGDMMTLVGLFAAYGEPCLLSFKAQEEKTKRMTLRVDVD